MSFLLVLAAPLFFDKLSFLSNLRLSILVLVFVLPSGVAALLLSHLVLGALLLIMAGVLAAGLSGATHATPQDMSLPRAP